MYPWHLLVGLFIFSIPLVVVGFFSLSQLTMKLSLNLLPHAEKEFHSTVYIELFGFLTIPMMSFIASLIGVCLLYLRNNEFMKNKIYLYIGIVHFF